MDRWKYQSINPMLVCLKRYSITDPTLASGNVNTFSEYLGKLTHQDIGQMDTYVPWFEENEKNAGNNPTLGIVLCSEKSETVVKYSVLNGSTQLFASTYKLYLPTEAELAKEVEQGLLRYRLQRGL